MGRNTVAEDAARVNIAQLLDEQDRSVAWLTKRCNMPSGALWKVLHLGRALFVDEAVAIADALGVSLVDLVTLDAERVRR